MTKITKILTTIKLTPILTATVLVGVIFLLGPGILNNAEADVIQRTDWLECRPTSNGQPGDPICDLQTGVAFNNLVSAPPAGLLVVLEPDTFEHQSTWESAPSANPVLLSPGDLVTLDLLHVNRSENANDQDICWSKHAILPDGSEIVIVQQHCFENPLPTSGFICPNGGVQGGLPGTPDISAACIAAAGVASETVVSSIGGPTVLPAGTVIELNISCPGSSFLHIFFNNGIDVDGDGTLEFTTLKETEHIPQIDKTLTEGPVEIGIYLPTATGYFYEIAITSFEEVLVKDTVPAEFKVLDAVSSFGDVTVTNQGKGAKSQGATTIEWLVPAGVNTLTVEIETVESPGKGHGKKGETVFKPTSCGPLSINDGATAFEVDEDGNLVLVEVVDPTTGEVTLEPVVVLGPSNSLEVEAVEGAKPCIEVEEPNS